MTWVPSTDPWALGVLVERYPILPIYCCSVELARSPGKGMNMDALLYLLKTNTPIYATVEPEPTFVLAALVTTAAPIVWRSNQPSA